MSGRASSASTPPIEPLIGTAKLGPVLWQLPERFQRDDQRLARCATHAARRTSLLRVSPPELVRRRRLRAAARASRGARDRRPSTATLSDPRADHKLDLRANALRARGRRQLLRGRARGLAASTRAVADERRGVRLFQQRLGGVRGTQRTPAARATDVSGTRVLRPSSVRARLGASLRADRIRPPRGG